MLYRVKVRIIEVCYAAAEILRAGLAPQESRRPGCSDGVHCVCQYRQHCQVARGAVPDEACGRQEQEVALPEPFRCHFDCMAIRESLVLRGGC